MSRNHLTIRNAALCAMAFLAVGTGLTASEPKRPPNIVLIMADDLGFADLGCYGSEIETPNLDALAANGLRFTQFYNTGRCWPTRAALLTGLYPHQARMAMNFGPEAPAAYSGNVPQSCRMIPEVLAMMGYQSYHVGKWHLNMGGTPNATWPTGRGFAHSLFLPNTDNYFKPGTVWYDDTPQTKHPADFYATDAFTDQAIAYLKAHHRDHAERPFFLYLAHIAPHFPLHARPEDVARFRGRYKQGWDELRLARHRQQQVLGLLKCALSPRDSDTKAWSSLTEAEQDDWDARMATYAAMIYRIDQGVGRLVKQLEAMQAFDDTLLLFLSDNGSSAEYIVRGGGNKPGSAPGSAESFRCLETGWSNAANTPFRFHKMWMHEGGISSPLIVHWPSGLKSKGELRTQPGHVIDVLPTLLDVSGANYPVEHAGQKTIPLPGRSLVPALTNQPVTREFLFWEHIGNKAIRQGDWKLVAEEDRPWELYNLTQDRSELHDLSKEQPQRVEQMSRAWNDYAKQIGVVEWATLPQSKVKPSPDYRRK